MMPGQQGPGAHLSRRCPSPAPSQTSSPEPGCLPLTLPTLGVQSLLPKPPNQLVLPPVSSRERLGSRERAACGPCKGHIYSAKRFCPGEKKRRRLQQERGKLKERGLPDGERKWETHSVSWEGGGPLPLRRPLSAPWPWAGRDSPLEASSVRAGRSGPSGLNRGHSMSGRHILRRGRGRETNGGESRVSPPLKPPSGA